MLHYKRSYILSFITAFSLIISNCREGPNTIIPGKIEKDIVKEMIAEIIIDREEKIVWTGTFSP